MPDLFRHWLTGERVAEATNASTTQLLDAADPRLGAGSSSGSGLPAAIFPPVVAPGRAGGSSSGRARGRRRPGRNARSWPWSARTTPPRRWPPCPPTRPASPTCRAAPGRSWASSWPRRALGAGALEANLSNERGYGGTVRFLRNVMGLWLLQECRRAWLREGVDLDYEAIARLAGTGSVAPP